jgi:hypothetical protein
VKGGRKDLSNISPRGKGPDEALNDCTEKLFKENPHLSTRKTAKASTISSMTVRNNLTNLLGMKYDDI